MARPRTDVVAVAMPGFGSTKQTRTNAQILCDLLDVSVRNVDITKAVLGHFEDIGHDPAELNVVLRKQPGARAHAGAHGHRQPGGRLRHRHGRPVRAGAGLGHLQRRPHVHVRRKRVHPQDACALYRARLRGLVRAWTALQSRAASTYSTRPSARSCFRRTRTARSRRRPEDLVGPYELHDFFLYYVAALRLRAGEAFAAGRVTRLPGRTTRETIRKWLTTFTAASSPQQFKRSCLPDGPKVGSVSLSPRGDWRMPCDASGALWLRQLETLR